MEKTSGTFRMFYYILGVLIAVAALYVNVVYTLVAVLGLAWVYFTFARFDLSFLTFLLLVPIVPHEYWDNVFLFAGSGFYFIVFVIQHYMVRREKVDFKKCGASFLIFAAATVLGVVFSYDRADSLRVFLFFLSAFFIFFTLLGFVKDKKTLLRVLRVLFVGVLIASLFAIYQNAVGVAVDPSLTDVNLNAGMPGRAYGTFGNPNNFAEYLVLLMPFCFAFALQRRSRAGKTLWMLALLLPLMALIFTLSRSSWVAFAISAVVFLAFMNWRVIPAVLILAAISLPIWPDYVVNRIFTIGDMRDTSNSVRVYIWRDSLAMMKDHWMTGIGLGPNAFHMIYPNYAKDFLEAPHSHMLFLEMWVETGIIGGLAFLGVLLRTLKKAWQRYFASKDATIRYTMVAALSALLGISFVGLVEYIFFYPRVMFVFFMVLGITLAAVYMKDGTAPQKMVPDAESIE